MTPEVNLMTQVTTNPKKPEDGTEGPINWASPRNLVKLAFCTLLYSVVQCCYNAFNGIVDWTKSPDMHTVHTVLHSIKAAATLGSIRGVMLGLMAVIVVWVGPPFWSIIGPVVSNAAQASLRFIGAFARAARSKGPFDPKDPLDLHGGGPEKGDDKTK
jgi:hypothetical protein